MFYEVIIFFFGSCIGTFAGLYISIKICSTVLEEIKKATPDTPVERLKNALFSFALMEVKHADVTQMHYADFTGEELPAMSGCSIENACFSYMGNKDSFRKSPFYTKQMEQKQEAIEKYIQHHLNTDEKVLAFFMDFYENLESEKWSLEKLERIHL